MKSSSIATGSLTVALLAILVATHPLSDTVGHQAIVTNGTVVSAVYNERVWLYCHAQVPEEYQMHQYQISWMRGSEVVGPWSANIQGPQVFSLGGDPHLPYSYLVFQPFVQTHTSVYTCVLTYNGVSIHQTTINVYEKSSVSW